ncbi:MAG: 23S rRNA (guanosine(2251)-2'-O)-methyltransferase RlmB [Coxiella sp. RIFCSPHIGHO2_12_FULL_44_14]|nr:MAG: 23S rRNA (guanosine(2251)-2'-O)-methyltransferase RlmB [Coxiella sp. RIFCSPHIGHO2_12_FULL_44_14]
MNKLEFVYGYHAIKALLDTQPHEITQLWLPVQRFDQKTQLLLELAQQRNIPVKRVTAQEIADRIGEGALHQGMLALCRAFSRFDELALSHLLAERSEAKLLLILDGIQDPRNLGACIRSANAFGVHAVIAPKDRAVGITPAVQKAASGALAGTPFVSVTNLARTLRWLKQQGIWIVGAVADTDVILSQIHLEGDIALVLGGEGSGLRRLTRDLCDFLAAIPMQGSVGSLNVSVAAGICLYEVYRQRH